MNTSMQHAFIKWTSFGKRHLVLFVAIVIGITCSVLSTLPGWHAGAQAPINDQIAYDRVITRDNGVREVTISLINTDGSGNVPLGKGFGPSFSPDASQIVFTFPASPETRVIYKMNSDGTNPTQLTESFQEQGAAWSPNGTQIAFVSERDDPEYIPGEDLFSTPRLYLMDVEGNGEKKVMTKAQSHTTTHTLEWELAPTWSPNGSQLAFVGFTRNASGSTRTNIYIVNADGSGLREVTNFDSGVLLGTDKLSWSPDGTKIAFARARDINVVDVDGASAPINLTNTTDREESDPAFSPGGGRIAYIVNHTDSLIDGIYIMKADGKDPRQILNATAPLAANPAWNPLAQDPTEPAPSPSPSPTPYADMSISMTALPMQPLLGEYVTYDLVVKNNGTADVTDSSAAFHHSPNLEFVLATPEHGVCGSSNAPPFTTECQTGPLAAGASTHVTILVRSAGLGEGGITGTVGSSLHDPDTTNNLQTLNVTVSPPCVPEVTSEVETLVWRWGFPSSRNARHTIFARNDSGRTLNGLVHFVLEGLDERITEGDPESPFSLTACAKPFGRRYQSVSIPGLVWQPGQVIHLDVRFFNPEKLLVDYKLRIYTGPGNP
ncbi:MAG TPA: hypothetical protein VFY60_04415 [Pyrinomonadaceae bacterium]|nr:hypothetical protein [Pyrinomonadaceae bacterium]